jgi:serine/threonine-protein kinase
VGLLDSLKSLVTSDKLNVESRYELLREAVTGTMSTFHMARDRKTGEVVGLKLLDAEKTAMFEGRFKGLAKPSEGEIGAAINHPRVVKTLRHGLTTKGQQFIITEFLEGPVLSSLILARDPGLQGKRLELIRQMAEAVAAVHEAGFIHRDICPRNYIAARDAGSVKLIDFGLTLPMKKEFMQPGNRTGTPSYLAPEIVRRKPTDHRVDIFALGVSAYYLCAFEFPWPSGDATGKVALRHDTQPPESILTHAPTLNPKLADAIMKCISVDPEERPASAEQLVKTLRPLRGDEGA